MKGSPKYILTNEYNVEKPGISFEDSLQRESNIVLDVMQDVPNYIQATLLSILWSLLLSTDISSIDGE